MSKSTYCYSNKNRLNDGKNSKIVEDIKYIYEKNNGYYGYRRINSELKAMGYVVNHKKVKRLMSKLNLFGKTIKKRNKSYSSYKGTIGKVADNIINRNFKCSAPNKKWTTDITEFHIAGGKLYLSPILDMYNSEIISYVISTAPKFAQVITMIDMAFDKIPNNTGLIFHSDQGWQYQHKTYSNALKKKGIIQSMSRKGNCLDNSIMENFFGVLKREMFYGHEDSFKSLYSLEQAIDEYIEYYNSKRIKMKLGGLSPYQFKTQAGY